MKTSMINRILDTVKLLQPKPQLTLGEKILAKARSFLQVRERGRNAGTEVERFLASVGSSAGSPWCAAFVYCITQDVATAEGKRPGNAKTGRAVTIYSRAIDNGLFTYTPEQVMNGSVQIMPGDIFVMVSDARYIKPLQEGEDIKTTGHTGFCTGEYDAEKLEFGTVEGNTNGAGSREGDGVYEKKRKLSENIVGFVRPVLV